MNIELKITVRSIVRWEQMTGRAYTSFDATCEDDVYKMMYCSTLYNNKEIYTYDEFLSILQSKQVKKELMKRIDLFYKVNAQFSTKQEDGQEVGGEVRLSDIVFRLISSGLDAVYVLDIMEICDIEEHLKAIDAERRARLEESRLWTYLTISPHVDHKKIKSPESICTFPWEEEQKQQEAHREIVENKEMFEAFMNGKLN